ncbi:hypothetical protein [Burkholderia territorii]|uniref:hypothetical protein n=1 Tax=Burkholderia territorii TaxID=1503055 RepID=UPI000A49D475|nr:hypothetical protein [Burkholderia territorii]
MKKMAVTAFLILIAMLGFASTSCAKNISFKSGMEIDFKDCDNKRVNPDGSDSVCVDVDRLEAMATVCIYNQASDKISQDNGFIKYRELPQEGRDRISPLPDEALVYVEGSYGAVYELKREEIGDFIVYEIDNTLCDASATAEKRPAVCYVAALVPSKTANAPPAIFVSAIIEQPPSRGGKLDKKAENKVESIKKIIESIRLGK